MDMLIWGGAAFGLLLIAALTPYFAPARTTILIDTATSTARAEMRLLWGMGPMICKRLLPQRVAGHPLAVFNDVTRIGHALMTPGIAEATYGALRRLFALRPKVARFELCLNLANPAQNLVVVTAAQAVLAMAPSAIKDKVTLGKCDAPGAELSAKFELHASPARIGSIYDDLSGSRAGKEFARRLKRKPKAVKKPVREVRAS